MNNADGFAMAFDEVWGNEISKLKDSELTQEEKISLVFSKIDDHPFLIENPIQAKEVAIFRIRLLDLK